MLETKENRRQKKLLAIEEERARLTSAAISELPPANIKALGMLSDLVKQMDRIDRLRRLTNQNPESIFSQEIARICRDELKRLGG